MKYSIKIIISIVILCVLVFFSLRIGETFGEEMQTTIVMGIRLPRTLMAIGCGSLLAISGCIMQGIFKNPLVEPYTMGISGGALVGVGIGISLGLSTFATDICAMTGALSTMVIVLFIRQYTNKSTETMLLSGVMISFATSSITTLIMSISSRENITQILGWSLGSLDAVNNERAYIVFFMAMAATSLSPLASRTINTLALGEEAARHVGLDTKKATAFLFIIASTLTSTCVASIGIVAFVGLIVPHAVRAIYSEEHAIALPMCGIIGGAFLLTCDMMGRTILYPQELPAGVFSGIIGGISFIIILCKRWSKQRT